MPKLPDPGVFLKRFCDDGSCQRFHCLVSERLLNQLGFCVLLKT